VKGWIAPMPTIDPEIVLRSAALLDYGPHFRYGHYLRAGSIVDLAGLGFAIGGIVAGAQLETTRNMLLKWKSSGDGPDEAARAQNFFRVTFLGDDGTKRIVTRVSGGDPGYGETAKMLSEAALALVLDRPKLEERAGILTPATALGEVLIDRLNRVGIEFQTMNDAR
jgi:short subunit dehydrogenase-like uncharacterized protein